MSFRNLWRAILRVAFHHFYNSFAFTYDPVSTLVSRGHWRAWTRAAIPYIVGTRVLEIPCGTGNLMLDLMDAGFHPIEVDLSSAMLRITQRKLRRAGTRHSSLSSGVKSNAAPQLLLQARAESLPFASAAFDSIVMTFPPGFAYDPQPLAEFHRLLDSNGRLIWVDGGRLSPRDLWNRTIQNAVDLVEGAPSFLNVASEMLSRAKFDTRAEIVRDEASVVSVVIATKKSQS